MCYKENQENESEYLIDRVYLLYLKKNRHIDCVMHCVNIEKL